MQEELGLPHDALQKILTTKGVAIAAEFKRASPSKGDIAVDLAAAGEWIQGLGISDAVRGWAQRDCACPLPCVCLCVDLALAVVAILRPRLRAYPVWL